MEKKRSFHHKKIKDESQITLQRLRFENKLQQKQINENYVNKNEMKNEISRSSHIQKDFFETMSKVENQGGIFASKLQEQKRKYEELTFLVQHFDKVIYSQKVQKKEDKRKQTDEYEIQDKKLKEKEKYYDQLIIKTNASSYEVSKKVEQVSTQRSERTVFNSVLDKIEKELFDLQIKYKKTLLQKIQTEKKLKNEENHYIQIEKKTEKQYKNFQKTFQLEKKKKEKDSEGKQQEEEQEEQNKEHIQKCFKTKIKIKKKTEEPKQNKKINEKEYENIRYEIKTKQVLNQLKIRKIADLSSKEKVQQQIDKLYDENNKVVQRIYEIQQSLRKFNKTKMLHKASQCNFQKPNNKKNIKEMIREEENAKLKVQTEIKEFQDKLTELVKCQEGEGMVEKIGRVDELIKSKFLKKDVSEPEKEEVDVGKLNHILNLNRQSKNNFRIYSEAQLLQISKFNLSKQ